MSGSNVHTDENGVLVDSETGIRFTTAEVSLARAHNFWHHGKDHYEADRVFAERVSEYPGLASAAYAARKFQFDTTKHLITKSKITQFLDLGVGLPVDPYLHNVAAALNREAKVVYADYDPLVAAHARALLDIPPGAAYLHGDFTDPAHIFTKSQLPLDFSQPIAVSLVSVLEYMPVDPHTMLASLYNGLAPGSYLLLASFTDHAAGRDGLEASFKANGVAFRNRSLIEFSALFDGFDLLSPGVVPVDKWTVTPAEGPRRLRPGEVPDPTDLPCYVGLGRKP
ncbi:SAM-dependent methyltransferase [Nocardia sp. NBC_01499]|uniref:SAM-dependent methyltransferase n=1 Tax=Nocardia sp. NBC_01499 TaxID=2903597 RepID=UPI00386FBC04